VKQRVILASASPRRRQLLEATGLPFDVVESGYEEDNHLDLPPDRLVKHLAEGKAAWVAERHPDAIVIAADTLVILDGRVMGKPSGSAEVGEMITALSGRWHSVFTGLALARAGRTETAHTETRVHFKDLSPQFVERYSRLSDPLDKAGAYGIQTTGALFIDRIEGDYNGVVGLPMALVAQRLKTLGIDLLDYAILSP
jgi:septum formation protein